MTDSNGLLPRYVLPAPKCVFCGSCALKKRSSRAWSRGSRTTYFDCQNCLRKFRIDFVADAVILPQTENSVVVDTTKPCRTLAPGDPAFRLMWEQDVTE